MRSATGRKRNGEDSGSRRERRRRRLAPGAALVASALLIALLIAGCSALPSRGPGAEGERAGAGQDTLVTPLQEPAYPGEDADSRHRHPVNVPLAESALDGGAAVVASEAAPDKQGDSLIVRTKSMLVRVDDVRETVGRIRSIVEEHRGTVETLQLSDDDGVPVYWDGSPDGRPLGGYVTVRIPVERYDAFVADAAKLGRVVRQSENSSDVTQEHVDLNARLDNLRAEEARLREMFEEAEKVSEMLDVERELSRVRGEAEALQARIDLLERQAALSTITIELEGPEPIVEPSGVDWGVADALREALRGFMSTVNSVIVLAGSLAPVLLLLALAGLVLRAVMRRRRARKAQAAQPDEEASGDVEEG